MIICREVRYYKGMKLASSQEHVRKAVLKGSVLIISFGLIKAKHSEIIK